MENTDQRHKTAVRQIIAGGILVGLGLMKADTVVQECMATFDPKFRQCVGCKYWVGCEDTPPACQLGPVGV